METQGNKFQSSEKYSKPRQHFIISCISSTFKCFMWTSNFVFNTWCCLKWFLLRRCWILSIYMLPRSQLNRASCFFNTITASKIHYKHNYTYWQEYNSCKFVWLNHHNRFKLVEAHASLWPPTIMRYHRLWSTSIHFEFVQILHDSRW